MRSSRIYFGGGKITAQQTRTIVCNPKGVKAKASAIVSDAKYALPTPLRSIGAIGDGESAVCNLLFRNPVINGDRDAYLLAPGDKPVVYKDESAGNPAEWLWTVPGYPDNITTQDASVTYATPGVYDLPTLQVTTAAGKSSYSPGYKIKVGGTSEISTIDCREWGTTYALSAQAYDNNNGNTKGFLGGTNALGIVGFGNLFMMGTDDAYLHGVNVYLMKKPTKFKEGATLRCQVWMVYLGDNELTLTGTPVEGQLLSMADIKDESDESVWIPIVGGAVAQFNFDQPLDLYGKTLFFVSIDGFSNDPTTEDFCILTDIVGKTLELEQYSNMLSHNSFARLEGESDYMRPISSYGGGYGSFAICPVISLPEVGAGIRNVAAGNTGKLKAAFTGEGSIEIETDIDAGIRVADTSGKLIAAKNVKAGKTVVDMPHVSKGIYIVSDSKGNSVKIVR